MLWHCADKKGNMKKKTYITSVILSNSVDFKVAICTLSAVQLGLGHNDLVLVNCCKINVLLSCSPGVLPGCLYDATRCSKNIHWASKWRFIHIYVV